VQLAVQWDPMSGRHIGLGLLVFAWNLGIAAFTWVQDQSSQFVQLDCFDQAPNCPAPVPFSTLRWVAQFIVGNLVLLLAIVVVRWIRSARRAADE
jgi:hypothetical protein